MKLCFPPHLSSASALPCILRNRKPRRQRTGALCVQHSTAAAALSTSFLVNHAQTVPVTERIDYESLVVIQQHDYEP